MAICPDGHDSLSDDYCDICGMRIGAAPDTAAAPPPAAESPASAQTSGHSCPQCGSPKSPGAFCEVCGFNYATGTPTSSPAPAPSPAAAPTPAPSSASVPAHSPSPAAAPPPAASPSVAPAQSAGSPTASYATPPSTASLFTPSTQGTWSAVVAADRVYYDQMQALSGDDGSDIAFPAYCPERRFVLTGTEMRVGRRSPSRGLNPEIDLTGPPTDPGISRLHAVLMATPDGWAVLDPGSANGTQVNGTDVPTGQQVPLHDGDRISLGAWTTITIHTT